MPINSEQSSTHTYTSSSQPSASSRPQSGVSTITTSTSGTQSSWSLFGQAHSHAPQLPPQLAQSPANAATTSRVQTHGHASTYIYLCTKRGKRFHFSEISTCKDDKAFFLTLKNEYRQKRGWLRLWLSLWQYDYCEFFEVRFPRRKSRGKMRSPHGYTCLKGKTSRVSDMYSIVSKVCDCTFAWFFSTSRLS